MEEANTDTDNDNDNDISDQVTEENSTAHVDVVQKEDDQTSDISIIDDQTSEPGDGSVNTSNGNISLSKKLHQEVKQLKPRKRNTLVLHTCLFIIVGFFVWLLGGIAWVVIYTTTSFPSWAGMYAPYITASSYVLLFVVCYSIIVKLERNVHNQFTGKNK